MSLSEQQQQLFIMNENNLLSTCDLSIAIRLDLPVPGGPVNTKD